MTLALGIHRGVAFEEYLAWPYPSQSVLKNGRASMAHLKAAIDGERRKSPTDDMILGSALHAAFLQPDLMPTRVALWTGERRAGAEWEAFKAEHAGKAILTAGMHANLSGMVKSLRKHPAVRRWQATLDDVEVSALGDLRGVTVKGRCDALPTGSEPLIDLKKVTSAGLREFTGTVMNLGYHLQGHVYRELFNRDRFVLIAVEGTPPYDVVPYEPSPAMLRHADMEVTRLLDCYRFACEHNAWPGRYEYAEPIPIELPEWAVSDEDADEITLNGRPLSVDEEDAHG